MKNLRSSVFETNSSSTHSISIAPNVNGIYSTIEPKDGVIVLTGGDFGWTPEDFYDSLTKANYCAIFSESDQNYRNMLIEVIKEHTGAKDVLFQFEEYSYIDHQSGYDEGGYCHDAFKDAGTLKEFIFNPASYLHTDNDNRYDEYDDGY